VDTARSSLRGERRPLSSAIRSVDKRGGKWLGYELEIVWGEKKMWASNFSGAHGFDFGKDMDARGRAYELITKRLGAANAERA